MGIIYIFIGIPATILLFAISFFCVFVALKIYKKINSNSVKVALLFIFSIPSILSSSLYLGGLLASLIHWVMVDANNGAVDILLGVFISFITATGNIIEPGSIMVSGSSHDVSTFYETSFSFIISLLCAIYWIFRYHSRYTMEHH